MAQENLHQKGAGPGNEEIINQTDARIKTEAGEGFNIIFMHDSGGMIMQHCLVDEKSKDYHEVKEIAIDKATQGCKVHILPVLPEEHPLREQIFCGAKEKKCPDMKIDGEYAEIKTPREKLHPNKINNNIKFAQYQANYVIIRLEEEFCIKRLSGIAKGRFISHLTLNVLEFKMNGEYFRFERSDFL